MSPNEFLVVNENRQKLREINGVEPEYVNFNNAATKFLLDQVNNQFISKLEKNVQKSNFPCFHFFIELQNRKRKFSLQGTKSEFDFRPVYNEPPPDFYEFKPVVNDVFRAMIAARKPISTSTTTIIPEDITAHSEDYPNDVSHEDEMHAPTAEARIFL